MKWIKLFLKFSFSFLIIGYMVYSGRLDLAVVRQGMSQSGLLLVCLSLIILAAFISFYRWNLLMHAQNLFFEFRKVIRYAMIGAFFNTTMPGAVSGDIIKAWYVVAARKGQPKTPVLTSILLDRIIGVFGLITVSTTALLFNWNLVWSIPGLQKIALFVLMLALGVLVFFTYIMLSFCGPIVYIRKKIDFLNNYKGGEILLKAYDAWTSYRQTPSILVKSMLLSVGTHLCAVGAVAICAQALGDHSLALYHYFLLVPLGLLTTAIPVAPAGLGVGHVAFGALFTLVGSGHGPEIFTLFVTVQIFVNLSGVIFYLKTPKPVQVAAEI